MPEPLHAYQYGLIRAILEEPLTASELASVFHRRFYLQFSGNPTLSVSNRLRPLVKRGWLTVENNIYYATERARKAVSW